jgi:hypothetical protein
MVVTPAVSLGANADSTYITVNGSTDSLFSKIPYQSPWAATGTLKEYYSTFGISSSTLLAMLLLLLGGGHTGVGS